MNPLRLVVLLLLLGVTFKELIHHMREAVCLTALCLGTLSLLANLGIDAFAYEAKPVACGLSRFVQDDLPALSNRAACRVYRVQREARNQHIAAVTLVADP
jgi:hypothetical protein